MNSFDLIMQKDFEQAIMLAEEKYQENGSLYEKYHKIIALLNLFCYNEAYLEGEDLIKKSSSNAYYQIYGLCCWLNNIKKKAVEYWILDINGKSTDISNGLYTNLLLYYAGIKNKDESLVKDSLSFINKFNKKKGMEQWMYYLTGYILGKDEEKELIKNAKKDKDFRDIYLCKSYFYIYLQNELNQNFKNNVSYLKKILNLSGMNAFECEFFLTKKELNDRGILF